VQGSRYDHKGYAYLTDWLTSVGCPKLVNYVSINCQNSLQFQILTYHITALFTFIIQTKIWREKIHKQISVIFHDFPLLKTPNIMVFQVLI